MRKETVDIGIIETSRIGGRKKMQSFRITSGPPLRKKKKEVELLEPVLKNINQCNN